MTITLDQLPAGQNASVVSLLSTNPARLDKLSGFGLVPGSAVAVSQRSPALIVRITSLCNVNLST